MVTVHEMTTLQDGTALATGASLGIGRTTPTPASSMSHRTSRGSAHGFGYLGRCLLSHLRACPVCCFTGTYSCGPFRGTRSSQDERKRDRRGGVPAIRGGSDDLRRHPLQRVGAPA